MKLLIISPGKQHDLTVADAIKEYQKRLSTRLPIEWFFPSVGTKEEEGMAILKQIKDGDFVLLLDEHGRSYSSTDLAKLVDTRLQDGTKRLVCIIGGAFGVSEEVKKRANATLSLSAMVFPHMIVRLMLTEQLYRAVTIIDGGKYHHK